MVTHKWEPNQNTSAHWIGLGHLLVILQKVKNTIKCKQTWRKNQIIFKCLDTSINYLKKNIFYEQSYEFWQLISTLNRNGISSCLMS